MAYFEPLPDDVLALQKELKNWPMITAEAMQEPDLASSLGAIAARIGILLDGTYDVPDLCRMLTKKLFEMRTTAIYIQDVRLKDVVIKEGANSVVIESVPDLPLLPKKAD